MIGNYHDPQHTEPEASIKQAFKWVELYTEQHRIDHFVKVAALKVRVDHNRKGDNLVALAVSAYEDNHLAALGLEKTVSAYELDAEKRFKLQNLVGDISEASFLVEHNFSSLNRYESSVITKSSLDKIGQALKIQEGADKIVQLEAMPNFQQLYLDNHVDFRTVLKLRKLGVSRTFRSWLENKTAGGDVTYITKHYLDDALEKQGYFEKRGAKFLKSIVMVGASAALSPLGAAVAGPIGAIFGAGVGAALGPAAVELGLGLFDSFVLDSLQKGATPKMFMDKLQASLLPD